MAERRSPGQRAGLSRERVLDAALAIVDRDGLAALTMRRLGGELGVEAMTIYHHLPGKDALLDGLVERVLDLASPPQPQQRTPDRAWDASMRDYAVTLRRTLRAHPGVLPIAVTRPAATPRTLRLVESSLALLRAAGFPLGLALDLFNALTVFVIGHVAAEVATEPVNERGAAGSTEYLAGLDATEFPLLTEAATLGEGTDDQARFGTALDAFLLGFAALRDAAA